MRIFLVLLLVVFTTLIGFSQRVEVQSPLRFLALGDSYTIGEGVPKEDSWPSQFVAALRKRGVDTEKLTVIAQTGWRTDNLMNEIDIVELDSTYNLVSLLIGVNNQFQGVNIDVYPTEFRTLLETAISLCDGNKKGVFVLSIPDYGYTPFGLSDQAYISAQIDQYNAINREITQETGIAYYDITPISREVINKPEYLATDNLHPSGEMYAKWIELILSSSNFNVITSNTLAYETTNKIGIFPNPASSSLTIRLPQKESSVIIYNSQGAKIWQLLQSPTRDIHIDVSDWSKGMYYYQVSGKNKLPDSGKFLKK